MVRKEVHSDSGATAGLCSYDFFIPLPQALPLPDGFQVNVIDIDDRRPSNRDALRFIDEHGLSKRLDVRIQFHRISAELDQRPMAVSFEAANHFYGLTQADTLPSQDGGFASVAHVAVIAPRGADDELCSQYFDEALRTLRKILKTYYAINRSALQLPSRYNIGPIITYSTEDIDDAGNPLDAQRSTLAVGLFMTGGPMDSFASSEADERSDKLQALQDEHIIETMDLMQQYLDAYREASAAEIDGEYISASILFAGAAEIYLDLLLQLLIWEEGVAPEKAFELIFTVKKCDCAECDKKISTTFDRVKAGMYAQKLGGDWDVYKSAMMKRWQNVRYTRNNAVHGGHEPSEAEVLILHETVDALVSWTLDLLARVIEQYPITAFLLAGQAGLERRGVWGTYTALDKGEVPTSMSGTFKNWRFEMMRFHPHSPDRQTKDTACDLVCLLHQDGKRYWVLCDFNKRLFRNLPEQTIEPVIEENLAAIESKLDASGRKKSVTVRVDDVAWKNGNGRRTWYPLYLLSSDFAITRHPTTFLIPDEDA